MRNRFKGSCELCGKFVSPGAGRWRLFGKQTQNFRGLRCLACSITTKAGRKKTATRLEALDKITLKSN